MYLCDAAPKEVNDLTRALGAAGVPDAQVQIFTDSLPPHARSATIQTESITNPDTQTKVLAKTQLRGTEGNKSSFKVGADEPYLTTSFSPIAAGGANVNPLSSYQFRSVGVNLEETPRVTDEGDILLDLLLSNDALGESRTLGNGQTAPSFTTRNVTGKLRLHDGESNLISGLLRDDERRTLRGFPGVISVPILKQLFSDSDNNISQTDLVMLLTPRIIRTHEYTARDLTPIYVGTNQNFGLTGPPPLIAAPETPAPETPQAQPAPPAQGVPPQGIPVPTVPQSGAPGLVTTQPAPAPTTLLPPAPTPRDHRIIGQPTLFAVRIASATRGGVNAGCYRRCCRARQR